jgi:hypothetical protein
MSTHDLVKFDIPTVGDTRQPMLFLEMKCSEGVNFWHFWHVFCKLVVMFCLVAEWTWGWIWPEQLTQGTMMHSSRIFGSIMMQLYAALGRYYSFFLISVLFACLKEIHSVRFRAFRAEVCRMWMVRNCVFCFFPSEFLNSFLLGLCVHVFCLHRVCLSLCLQIGQDWKCLKQQLGHYRISPGKIL